MDDIASPAASPAPRRRREAPAIKALRPLEIIPPAIPGAPPLPVLPTLHDRPSWCNNRGHVDRSACLAVRIGGFWRNAQWGPEGRGLGRIKRGTVLITAYDLDRILAHLKPRRLRGDFRQRSTAIMPENWLEERKLHFRRRRFRLYDLGLQSKKKKKADYGLQANPNAGATRTKVLGLPRDWECELKVECWASQVRNAKQPANLFRQGWDGRFRYYCWVCPGDPRGRGDAVSAAAADAAADHRGGQDAKCTLPSKTNALYPRSMRFRPCRPEAPRRMRQLFLPLCTQEEARDAAAAQEWIARFRAACPNAPGTALEAQLVERYGLLFHPRRFLCADCLALRHGRIQWRDRTQRGIPVRVPIHMGALGLDPSPRDRLGRPAERPFLPARVRRWYIAAGLPAVARTAPARRV